MGGETERQAEPLAGEAGGWEWAIVEIMGRRSHAGRIREEERFGAKMIRIDVPTNGDAAQGWLTHWYGGASIFPLRLSDEATVMKMNKPYESPYRLTVRREVETETGAESQKGPQSEYDDDESF